MNAFNAAKTLDALMLELLGKGAEIPSRVAQELKAGRSLAAISARRPERGEEAGKAAAVLEGVEMNLLSLAETHGGAVYAEGWQRRVAEAYQEPLPAPPPAARTVAPRGEYWLRIQTEQLKGAAPPDTLTAAAQEDGFTLIYGKREDVQAFLKDIREKLGKVGFERNS
jgi:hypothetical protein